MMSHTRTFWQRPEQMSACKAVLRIGSSQSFTDSPKRFVSERQSVKVRGTDQWTVRSMGEPPIRRWSEWGDVFCQNAKETVQVRSECGVQAFCPKGKTLKWAGFACPFEFDPGPPQSPKVLWGNQSDQWVSPPFADGASGGMFFLPQIPGAAKAAFLLHGERK